MKKILVFLFVVCSQSIFGQENELISRHEVKIHPLNFKLDASYEYILNKKNSIGFSYGNSHGLYNIKDAILPYYRRYFWKKNINANGFFAEANLLTYIYEEHSLENLPDKKRGYGAGFAFGYKYIDAENVFYEVFFGGGDGTESFSRLGLVIGKRFSLKKTDKKKIPKEELLAQQKEIIEREKNFDISKYPRNELRLNTAYLITSIDNIYYNIDYERVLKRNRSFGISVGGAFKFDTEVYDDDFLDFAGIIPDISVLPYFRKYFGKSVANGFFLESNFLLSYVYYKDIEEDGPEDTFRVGAGGAVGYKFVFKNNFVMELHVGGGLNLETLFYPRMGLIIGKRF